MPDPPASDLASSGSSADQRFADSEPGLSATQCVKKTWVAIELKDTSGNPVAGEAYTLELPDGRIIHGTLDSMGSAGVADTDPGQCKISFPNLDASEWKTA